MKNKYKILLRTGILAIITVLMLGALNSFFTPVWEGFNNYYTVNGFYEEPRNKVETVFLGASVPASDIAPMELYKDYGICAYNLSTTEQPVIASYYLLEDAYRLHSETLKTVVFEVSELRDEGTDQVFHKALDYMDLSYVKIKAAYDYCDGDFSRMLNYVFPFTEYHNRWSELEFNDFKYLGKNPVNGTRGYDFALFTYRSQVDSFKELSIKSTVTDESAEAGTLVESSLAYFDKMVKFCEEHGLNLVLIKLPANNWNSSLKKSIVSVAEEYSLEYIDFNFEPVSSEVKYIHAFESRDGRHANYFGAVKFTRWLGSYLVNECDATDVRGDKRYAYLEKQKDRYDKVFYRAYELSQTDNIADYISLAMQDNNSILLTVKEDAANALTDSQREFFRKIGLAKLAEIKANDSYIGVIENGKVIYEEICEKTEDKPDNIISYSSRLADGEKFTLASGYSEEKYVSSCVIEKEERSYNKTGINIVVYSNEYSQILINDTFDTSKSAFRQYYDTDFYKLINDEDALEKYADNTFFQQTLIYSRMLEAMSEGVHDDIITENNDIFSFIDKYAGDENNVIIISVKDDASNKLTDEVRENFASYGLYELSSLEHRDSYIAVIENGKVIFEEKENGNDKPLVYQTEEFYVESAGFAAGNVSSVKINGEEFSKNVRGLNVVVFNREINYILDSKSFDTYWKEITISAE